MKGIDHIADDAIIEATRDYLSDSDKKRFGREILNLFGALSFLAAGAIYGKIFGKQDIIQALIYFFGVLIIGLPIFFTAIKGLVSKNMESAMEILVSIAMVVTVLDGQFVLAILIPVILTLVHFLEEKSIMGGRDAIENLKGMQSNHAILLTEHGEKEVDARSLTVGDLIVIKPGMALPVDGEVVKGLTSVDQKSLTGESTPAVVNVGDPVYAGTVNIDGNITVKVTKEFSDTSFSKIVKLLEDAEKISIPESKIVDKFMFYYIPLTLVIAILVWIFTKDISRAVAILVVSCPCGHMLISSAPIIAALSNATKRGILIKNAAFIEQLAESDYVIFDKTGTITKGQLEAHNYLLEGAQTYEELISCAASVAHMSLHPVSKSIVSLCENIEYDHDYTIKEHIGKGLQGEKDGSVIYLGSYSWIRSLGFEVSDKYEDFGTCDWVVKDGCVMGCILFKDSPREAAAEAISELKSVGIRTTTILTGDRRRSAERIQREVGADEMFCELLPEQKLEHVERIMKEHTVTVIGDGINDALALSRAHVGIAMGAMGSDTAIQSADIALMNNDLSNIPHAIRLAKKTKNIIFQNIILAFTISFVMIFLAGAGIVSPILGAFLHNIGAFTVLINSGRIIGFKK